MRGFPVRPALLRPLRLTLSPALQLLPLRFQFPSCESSMTWYTATASAMIRHGPPAIAASLMTSIANPVWRDGSLFMGIPSTTRKPAQEEAAGVHWRTRLSQPGRASRLSRQCADKAVRMLSSPDAHRRPDGCIERARTNREGGVTDLFAARRRDASATLERQLPADGASAFPRVARGEGHLPRPRRARRPQPQCPPQRRPRPAADCRCWDSHRHPTRAPTKEWRTLRSSTRRESWGRGSCPYDHWPS